MYVALVNLVYNIFNGGVNKYLVEGRNNNLLKLASQSTRGYLFECSIRVS